MKRLDHTARRAALASLLVLVLVFLVAAWFARLDALSGLDHSARALVRDGRPPALAAPMRTLSVVATGYVLLPITAVCAIGLWRRRHRAVALALPIVGAAAPLVLALLKWIVNKPRPTERGYGFPSGHVFGVTVFVVVLVYLLWLFDAPRGVQRAARALGIIFVVVVGYSRLYLNAHWFSDVVGGLLAGVAFGVGAVLVMDRRLR